MCKTGENVLVMSFPFETPATQSIVCLTVLLYVETMNHLNYGELESKTIFLGSLRF